IAAVLLAAVAGSLLAVFSVQMKGVVDVIEHNPDTLWRTPWFYAWIFTGVAGMIYHQSAYRAGALTASLPTIIVAKPVVGGVLGITVLEETVRADGTGWFVLGGAAVMVIVATGGLARGGAGPMECGEGGESRAGGGGRDVKITDRPKAPPQRLSG